MRLPTLAFALLLVSGWSCAGDSSAPMSVWNDGGPGGSGGGQGGQTVPSAGGAGGAASGGSVAVKGGTRDLATAQCTSASSGGCAVDAVYLYCVESRCGTQLVDCYYSDGRSSTVGGRCQAYAKCMLACPCDSGQNACQNKCLEDYVFTNASCSMCLATLYSCMDGNGCALPSTCAS
jgi:hypothetical protein